MPVKLKLTGISYNLELPNLLKLKPARQFD